MKWPRPSIPISQLYFVWNYKMEQFSGVLVVEGKTDKDFIKTFLDCDIVTTNGSEVLRETIEYLKELSKIRQIVVLTDPDAPGKRIRDILNSEIPSCQNAYVRKEVSVKNGKVGVAESTKEEVLEALSHIIPNTNNRKSEITYADLYELGLVSKYGSTEKREAVEKALHIGHSNGKAFLKKCQCLGLDKEGIKRILNER